jgi:pheromone shutdown protein TraB
MVCSCMEKIEKRQIVSDYADLLVNDLYNTLGGSCEEVLEFAVEQVIVRMSHVLASIRHHEREIDDRRIYDEVSSMLVEIESRSPAVLNLIIEEYRAKENPDARH